MCIRDRLKAVRLTRLLRSEAVREVLYNFYLFLQAAFGVVDVIQDHSSAMTRATHLREKRTAFRDAQAALLDDSPGQSGAQVLMSVLLAKPSGLRTAALRLATGIVVDANRTAQAWFTERLKDGEVLRVAADEFRATCNHLERHHRRRRAGQPCAGPPGVADGASLSDCTSLGIHLLLRVGLLHP